MKRYPVTPDGRYFVAKGRLWRCTDPALSEAERAFWVRELMRARRMVREAKRTGDAEQLSQARKAVDRAKRALGERGTPWWGEGPDWTGKRVEHTPYRDWWLALNA
ncbi:MAG: hypothetical protein N2561_06195 [Bacteroidetes bacterium]|nr:hypothetical protein [Rhodothermia bacterium]MCS7154733.1 hypothetical protein [Bacteroidota bacterium]MCX7907110.1 hypothetical protein [Bacteroidota bacterium]MDW8137526.1 hypothetical protein [Bacteroidota bacterium]MDW8285520.1 hypothetical protein [Bacteroidota bacterium]